ncbi:MAG TPA: ABC-F family ATP-binding cassette domain-containing protein [Polyangiaceae bacterium]|nr:ABC-F family ATP-binding cassette domain-containing protein [Polyangiaceae bacterium]
MPIVTLSGVHKSYGTRVVLDGVELTIRTGERIGVVGRNGAGKSTLAKIVAGIEPADQGTVMRRRNARVEYLEQNPDFDGDPTAERAVLSGLSEWHQAVERHHQLSAQLSHGGGDVSQLIEQQATIAETVERLGGWDQSHHVAAILDHLDVVRRDVPVSQLSGGERRRVALGRLLVSSPDLAILDEPTNHLDAETIEWLEEYLIEAFRGALLLVTHDRYLLDRVTTRTVEVSDGASFVYDGGYERYLEQKAEREALRARAEQNRQNFLRRELEWLRRQPKARTTKQAARIARAEEAILQPKPKTEQQTQFSVNVTRSGKTILELHEASLGIGGRTLVQKLELFLREGERIGIVGKNGTGKTTLLRAILGQVTPTEGRIVLGSNTRMALLDQNRASLDDSLSVFENAVGDQTRISLGSESIEPHQYLERFGFDWNQQRQPVSSLSGGERARVALAKMLRQSANLLLLDEPTNDLDVQTLGSLESMLMDQGITALVVTHDRWFLDRVATSILAFEGNGRVVLYPGNFDTYRRLKAESRQAELELAANVERESKPKAAQTDAPRKPRKIALNFKEGRELAELPDAIEQTEAQIAACNARLCDPNTYTQSASEVPAIQADLESLRGKLEQQMARWEELERKKSEANPG